MRSMKVRLEPLCPFDLDLTLCCGQAFRWEKQVNWWYGVVGENVVKIRQKGDTVEFEGAESGLVTHYFGLKDDLPAILSEINKDSHIRKAVDEFRGLRVLRQDPWECLISYICATYKNIVSIKRMILLLSKRFGERITAGAQSFFTFPTPEKLAKASQKDLTGCELGYRANYVSQTSKMILQNSIDLYGLRNATHDDARRTLLELPGVGQKVADCVLLFGLGKLEAFPVDVWVKRAVLNHYESRFSREFIRKISGERSPSDSEYKRLNLFGREHFGRYAGYAQEYLYHYERTQPKRQRVSR